MNLPSASLPPPKLSRGLAILPLYFAVTIVIGWLASRQKGSARVFLNATRSLPLPVVAAAYLASNCGALEIVGLSAMAAQYGAQAFHFYWIGAVPALVFLALWMMPLYRRSGVRSLPEYLELRFGPDLRLLNTLTLSLTVILLAGISLYAMAQVLQVVTRISFSAGVVLSASVVLTYALLGGVRATIYNEVFQLIVMLAGLTPLAVRSIQLAPSSTLPHGFARSHLWQGLPLASNASTFDALGVVVGLGFVLSFGYWCTDFVQMQRAFATRTAREARQVPLWAGLSKLLISLVVVLPGLAAARLLPPLGPAQRFDQTLPLLMERLYGPALLSLGLTAVVASLMSGLAANVSAFAALFTEDLYRPRIRRNAGDAHYLMVGRLSTVAAVVLSAACSYLTFFFSNLMEHIQLIFSIVGAPFWAVFLLGITTRRVSERSAIWALAAGMLTALLHLLAVGMRLLRYGSQMTGSFHGAIYAFAAALIVGSLAGSRPPASDQASALQSSLLFTWKAASFEPGTRLIWTLSLLLIAACVALCILWR